MIIVLLGPPGAGKGTQCELLARERRLARVSTGELLREAAARRTALGELARPYVERGELVPDEVMIGIIREWLTKNAHAERAIFDGFPRTITQAEALDGVLADLGRQVDHAIYLRVPTEELIRRLSGRYVCPRCGATYHLATSPPRVPGRCDICGAPLTQRPDDRIEVIRHRLEVYLTQTTPVVDYYRRKGILIEVDGARPIETVFADVQAALPPVESN
jgi:adenylate kinase